MITTHRVVATAVVILVVLVLVVVAFADRYNNNTFSIRSSTKHENQRNNTIYKRYTQHTHSHSHMPHRHTRTYSLA